jgi:hypothetical protein
MKKSRLGYLVSLAVFILTPLLGVSTQAATITVKSNADAGGTCPGATCTLRQAIATAASGDTITFAAGITTINLTSDQLLIANKDLTISGPGANLLTIQRSAAAGTPNFRVFLVIANTVTISGLTISNGNVPTDAGGGILNDGGTVSVTNCALTGNSANGNGGFGGGIVNGTAGSGSRMTITNCTISGNLGSNAGGVSNGSSPADNSGTTMTISNSTISGNIASCACGGGGGIVNLGTATIINSTISGNSAAGTDGGGINVFTGTVTAKNTIIALNTAMTGPDVAGTLTSHGYNFIGNNSDATIAPTTGDQIGTKAQPKNPMLGSLQDNGGPTMTQALLSGSPAIEGGDSGGSNTDQRGFARPVDSPIIANVGDGSDIGAYEVQADVLPGCSSINRIVKNNNDSGTDSLRGVIANVCAGSVITFAPNVTGPITLTSGELLLNKSLTIIGAGPKVFGVSRSSAAGTSNFRIFNIATNTNVAITGMGISNGNAAGSFGGAISNSGTLTLTDDFLTANTAGFGGGAIHNNGGVLTINRSILFVNMVNTGAGGILNSGGSTLTIINSLINGNGANGGNGGGIVNSGTVTLSSTTISANFAQGGAGGGIHNASGTVTAKNSIIAKNAATSAPDYNGTLASDGFNLIGNSSGTTISPVQFSDQIGTAGSPLDPLLGPFQDNGGLTFSRGLLPGSPAIDKGDSGELATDQRGFPRPIDLGSIANATGGDGSDIGAFELQATPVLTTVASPSVALGDSIADTATLSGGSSPTGTITFELFGPNNNTCTGAPIKTFTINVNGNAAYSTTPFTPATPGVYNWAVGYSGDGANVGLSSPCGSPNQSVTVTQTVLGNISTRLRVETGDNVLIAGFIITGTQPKKVIVRGIGTSLPFPDKLADPTLELRDSTGALIDSNDNWGDSPNKQAIIDSTIAPSNDLESAIIATLPANSSSYTAIVRGVNNGTGIGVVEAYDLDTSANSKLANISTRGLVQTGDDVLIAGTIVVGQAPQKVIVEALGPSLSVPGNLADPILELRDVNGTLLDTNDNWIDSPNKQAIIDSTIPPTNDLESAIVATLPANGAQYTAIVRGVNETTGVAVVEVFALN